MLRFPATAISYAEASSIPGSRVATLVVSRGYGSPEGCRENQSLPPPVADTGRRSVASGKEHTCVRLFRALIEIPPHPSGHSGARSPEAEQREILDTDRAESWTRESYYVQEDTWSAYLGRCPKPRQRAFRSPFGNLRPLIRKEVGVSRREMVFGQQSFQ